MQKTTQPGGQPSQVEKTRRKSDDPDAIERLTITHRTLAKANYTEDNFESWLVIDIRNAINMKRFA